MTQHRTSSRRLGGDEGTALVEFALVAPLLVVLVFGLIDYGRLWNENNVLVRSVQSAARTGASQGTDRYADYNVLQSIEASLSALDASRIERVVVFRSETANGRVPPTCANQAIADDLNAKGVSSGSGASAVRCNIYSRAQVQFRGANVFTRFGQTSATPPACSSTSWDRFWCPLNRSRGSDTVDPEYLGVYVRVRAESLTGIVGLPVATVTSTSVFRLDPCITGVSCG